MRKQSVIIANRHSTSISLEDEFFDELKELARQKGYEHQSTGNGN